MVTQPEGDEPTDDGARPRARRRQHLRRPDRPRCRSWWRMRSSWRTRCPASSSAISNTPSARSPHDAEAGQTEPIVLRDSERLELEDGRRRHGRRRPQRERRRNQRAAATRGRARMTERIRSNTEAEFTESLSRRLSAANAVAIHPSAIRQAAATVTEAENEVARCDIDLAALGELPSSATGEREPSAGPERTDGQRTRIPSCSTRAPSSTTGVSWPCRSASRCSSQGAQWCCCKPAYRSSSRSSSSSSGS